MRADFVCEASGRSDFDTYAFKLLTCVLASSPLPATGNGYSDGTTDTSLNGAKDGSARLATLYSKVVTQDGEEADDGCKYAVAMVSRNSQKGV
jgi:hypothetical protein